MPIITNERESVWAYEWMILVSHGEDRVAKQKGCQQANLHFSLPEIHREFHLLVDRSRTLRCVSLFLNCLLLQRLLFDVVGRGWRRP